MTTAPPAGTCPCGKPTDLGVRGPLRLCHDCALEAIWNEAGRKRVIERVGMDLRETAEEHGWTVDEAVEMTLQWALAMACASPEWAYGVLLDAQWETQLTAPEQVEDLIDFARREWVERFPIRRSAEVPACS